MTLLLLAALFADLSLPPSHPVDSVPIAVEAW